MLVVVSLRVDHLLGRLLHSLLVFKLNVMVRLLYNAGITNLLLVDHSIVESIKQWICNQYAVFVNLLVIY